MLPIQPTLSADSHFNGNNIIPDILTTIFRRLPLNDMLHARIACKFWIEHTYVTVRNELLTECQKQIMTLFSLSFVLNIDSSQSTPGQLEKNSREQRQAIKKIAEATQRATTNVQKVSELAFQDQHVTYADTHFYSDLFQYTGQLQKSVQEFLTAVDLDQVSKQLTETITGYDTRRASLPDGEAITYSMLIEYNQFRNNLALALQNAECDIQQTYQTINEHYGNYVNDELKALAKMISQLTELKKMDPSPSKKQAYPTLESVIGLMLTNNVLLELDKLMRLSNQPTGLQRIGGLQMGDSNQIELHFPIGINFIHGCAFEISLLDEEGNAFRWGLKKR